MSKKLAIQGHPTRGKEVIELLEMLGGHNVCRLNGREQLPHWVADNNYICNKFSDSENCRDILLTFTLEEFWEKYPYKVGDKVLDLKTGRIAEVYKIHWSENNSRIYYDIVFPNKCSCQRKYMDLQSYDEETNMKENTTPKTQEEVNFYLQDVTIKNAQNLLDIEKCLSNDGLELPNNIIINKNGIGSIEFIKWYEKPTYPKTYEECEKILGLEDYIIEGCLGYEYKLLNAFQKLLMCRDAYCKIAGEQMGLDKPWEPDWNHINRKYYCIYNSKNNIVKNVIYSENKILAFPTEEMRDTFYENFKHLIEQCKELL